MFIITSIYAVICIFKLKNNIKYIDHEHMLAQMAKNLLAMQETQVQSLDWKDPL